MRVLIEAPDLPAHPRGFPAFWSRLLPLHGGPVSQRYQVHALAGSYVRLVEVALFEYRHGCAELRDFWETSDTVKLSAFNRSISHFETCVMSMHRAIGCYRRLRRNKDQDPLAIELNRARPEFITARIADRLRDVRHEIQHLDERLADGEILEGQSFALRPDGPDLPDPLKPDGRLKVFDRLSIGSKEILFKDLAAWLGEMCRVADRIATF